MSSTGLTRYHRLEFADPTAPAGWEHCRQCGWLVDKERFMGEECPGPTPMDDDLLIQTPYGLAAPATVETWPTLVCPVCGRPHAHPPGVTADYWPLCWACWQARPACFQRREEIA